MTDSPDMVTPEVADELRRMHAIAKTVNGSTTVDDPTRQVSRDFTAALQALVEQGVTPYRLGQIVGVQGNAIRMRLARHGYRNPIPSAARKAYRGTTAYEARRANQTGQ